MTTLINGKETGQTIQTKIKEEVDFTLDIGNLTHENINNYVKMLQLECLKHSTKIKCDICGSEVSDIKKHKTSQKCKKIRDGE